MFVICICRGVDLYVKCERSELSKQESTTVKQYSTRSDVSSNAACSVVSMAGPIGACGMGNGHEI